MPVVNMHQAKTNLSRLVERALAGEEIVIARSGKPVVKLVAVTADLTPRAPGSMRGAITLAEDFDAALPSSVLAGFEGRD